ncbi:condensation domain-containing protein, partial [Bradyrhizobium ottawaense]|uniref:condensation domain-containing protein n=1 Tax=Bradyrhizobium ottawaense TaxID=931866 RepID=UPI0030C6E30A
MSDEENVFLLTQHHIVSYGGRLGVLVHELSRLYRAFEAGQDDPLPPLAIQYPDYAAWQRQWLSGNGCRSRRSIGATPCQARPVLSCRRTVRGRPSSRLPGASVPVVIDADLTRDLKRLSRQHGTTLFLTVLAGWAAVLSLLSGQDEPPHSLPTELSGPAFHAPEAD